MVNHPQGSTLIIDEGTTINVVNGSKILVQNSLVVNGTSSNQVTFTSYNTNPTKADWGGIEITGSNATATFQYCNIEYATEAVKVTDSASATINNSTIFNSTVVVYFDNDGTCTVSNSTITTGYGATCINDFDGILIIVQFNIFPVFPFIFPRFSCLRQSFTGVFIIILYLKCMHYCNCT